MGIISEDSRSQRALLDNTVFVRPKFIHEYTNQIVSGKESLSLKCTDFDLTRGMQCTKDEQGF